MNEDDHVDYPVLTWVNDQNEKLTMSVEDRVFIGRVCQAVSENKRIIIDESNVSRDHAVVSRVGSSLTIKDTSRNGTRINGVRITSGSEHVLAPKDCIEIGHLVISVEFLSSAFESDGFFNEQTTRVISINETVTHLVADVRGFSGLTQRSESSVVFDLVGNIFQILTDAVHRHHGTVKDYAGDAIYAFWEHGDLSSPQKALDACLSVKAQFQAVNDYLALCSDEPLKQVTLGWGVATGASTLSHYGVRQDSLALVGDSTNLAFRLSGMANNTLLHPVIICSNTANLVKTGLQLKDVGMVKTKGRQGMEQVFTYNLV